MTLAFQLAEHKRKSQAINDFVIEATYVKDLAAQVLYADSKMVQTEVFQGACDTLRDLCEMLQASVIRLQELIPLSSASGQEKTHQRVKEASLDDPSLEAPSLDLSLQDASFPLLTPPFA